MSGDRERITTTNDAVQARVAVLSGGVVWYGYRRADAGLYLQREIAGVRDPEVKVADAVAWFDLLLDPAGTTAWVVFMQDTVLVRFQVTNLATDPLTLASYTRQDHWTDAICVGGGTVWTKLLLNGVEVLNP